MAKSPISTRLAYPPFANLWTRSALSDLFSYNFFIACNVYIVSSRRWVLTTPRYNSDDATTIGGPFSCFLFQPLSLQLRPFFHLPRDSGGVCAILFCAGLFFILL